MLAAFSPGRAALGRCESRFWGAKPAAGLPGRLPPPRGSRGLAAAAGTRLPGLPRVPPGGLAQHRVPALSSQARLPVSRSRVPQAGAHGQGHGCLIEVRTIFLAMT